MKARRSWWPAFLLAFLVWFGVAGQALAQTVMFSDGFESDSTGAMPAKWQHASYWSDAGTNYVTNSVSSTGSKSLRVYSYQGGQKGVYAPSSLYQGDHQVSFDVYLPSGGVSGVGFGGMAYAGMNIFFKYAGSNTASLSTWSTGSDVTVGTVSTERWNSIVIDFDWTNSKFSVKINGTSAGSYLFTKSVAGGFSSDFSAYGDNNSGPRIVYFDNVAVQKAATVSSTPYSGFAATQSNYSETADLTAACQSEYGSSYKLADWTDLDSFYQSGGSTSALFSALAWTEYDSGLFVSYNGQRMASSTRYYFASKHDGALPTTYSYLSHANIGSHIIDLGSWYGNTMRALCYSSNSTSSGNKLTIASAKAKWQTSPSTSPSLAIDGSSTTVYSSAGTHDYNRDPQMWWEGDLGSAKSVKSIRVLWYQFSSEYWKEIEIKGSQDGSTYTTLVSRSRVNVDGTWTTFTVDGSYRYLRLYYVGSGTGGHGLDLVEFEAYGTADSTGTTSCTNSTTCNDCLFNWAERSYANLFSPSGASSTNFGHYYFRYYTGTNAYLAVSSNDSRLYYLGPLSGNAIMDVGPVSTWYATAGCSAN